MGMAPQDLARLRGEITGLRDERRELLNNMVRDARERGNAVAAMKRHFHDAHAEMARTAREERCAYVSGIKAGVCSMQTGFHNDLVGIRDQNARRARQTRQECASFVSGLKAEVMGMRAGFICDHSHMARKTKVERLAFIADQEKSVAGMRAEFRHDHNVMAKNAKNIRLRFLSGLNEDLSNMRSGFRKDLADCSRSNVEMFKKARAERSAFAGELKQEVANRRQEFASEIAGSRLAWLGITGLEEKSGAKIAQKKPVQWDEGKQQTEPATGDFIEFKPIPESRQEPVVLEAAREIRLPFEAAKHPVGGEEKKMSKKEKRRP